MDEREIKNLEEKQNTQQKDKNLERKHKTRHLKDAKTNKTIHSPSPPPSPSPITQTLSPIPPPAAHPPILGRRVGGRGTRPEHRGRREEGVDDQPCESRQEEAQEDEEAGRVASEQLLLLGLALDNGRSRLLRERQAREEESADGNLYKDLLDTYQILRKLINRCIL